MLLLPIAPLSCPPSQPHLPHPLPQPSQIQNQSSFEKIFTRHIQRILDALPSAAQAPKTQESSRAVPVSVSPGIGRVDTVSRVLNADWTGTNGKTSWLGAFLQFFFSHIIISGLVLLIDLDISFRSLSYEYSPNHRQPLFNPFHMSCSPHSFQITLTNILRLYIHL